MSSVKFRVFTSAGVEVGAGDATAFAKMAKRGWTDRINEPGGGGCVLDTTDPWAQQIGDDYLVKCYLDDIVDPVFEWVIERRLHHTISPDEEVGQLVELSGPGRVEHTLQRALVFPQGGLATAAPIDARAFDWTNYYYYRTLAGGSSAGSAFGAAVGEVALAYPPGWPASAAKWIWPSGFGTNVPVGDVYLRLSYNHSETRGYSLYATANNAFELFVDGQLVLSGDDQQLGKTFQRAEIVLGPGWHQLAIRGRNDAVQPAGVLMAMIRKDAAGNPENVLSAATGTHWSASAYPASGAPGMTPGNIMGLLIDEAVARGTLKVAGPSGSPNLGLDTVAMDFTIAADSNGAAWTTSVPVTINVGTDLMAVLQQLSEVAVDWRFTRNAAGEPLLRMFNALGADRAARLVAGSTRDGQAPGGNLTALDHEVATDSLYNVLLSRYRKSVKGDTGWREDTSAASVTARGRREAFLSAGPQPPGYIAKLAAALFAGSAVPAESVTAGVEVRPDLPDVNHRARPYQDYGIGDRIWCPDRTLTAVLQRVRGITVAENDDGIAAVVPELGTLTTEWEERLQRWLQRMAAGSLGGTSFSAAPIEPAAAIGPAEPGAWVAYTPTWTGTIGNGTITGSFTVIGKTVMFRFAITWGSTTTHPAGWWEVGLPVASSEPVGPNAVGPTGTGVAMDAGVANYPLQVARVSGTAVRLIRENNTFVTNVAPFTWASGDALLGKGMYEIT